MAIETGTALLNADLQTDMSIRVGRNRDVEARSEMIC